jgi:hypothetical protein
MTKYPPLYPPLRQGFKKISIDDTGFETLKIPANTGL